MFRRIVVYICSLLLFVFPAGAEGLSRERKAVKVSGDVLLAAMPVATVATVLAMKDWTGAKQGLFTGVTTLGVSYLLKFTVKKDRPIIAIDILSLRPILLFCLPMLLLFNADMVGNGVLPPMC